jgi:hypothetical protein
MRRWADDWKARNGWDLDQLAAIVDTLRSEQLTTFELAAQEYDIPSGGQLFMLMLSADALRLYAHLLPAQRQALTAGRSLSLGSLNPAQRPLALDLARGRGRSLVQMFMGPPPWRSPQDLARATLSLKGMPAPAMFRPPTAPAPPRPGAEPRAETGAPAPPVLRRLMAIFELRFPEGRPETFVVPGVLPPGTPLPMPEKKEPSPAQQQTEAPPG